MPAENKKRILISFVVLGCCAAVQAKVDLGIDVLQQKGYNILAEKRVTNQTGADSSGKRLRVPLHEHCNLVAVWGWNASSPGGMIMCEVSTAHESRICVIVKSGTANS